MEKTTNQAREILDFWFAPENVPKHFVSDPDFDAEISRCFKARYQSAKDGELEAWKDDPESLLALIILLDQFPRNMFRGTAAMFATDEKAVHLSYLMLDDEWDMTLSPLQRAFVYMPLEHSENMADQKRSVKEFNGLGIDIFMDYAKRHYDTIERFGRFPSRNAALGRESTPAEEIFLRENPTGF